MSEDELKAIEARVADALNGERSLVWFGRKAAAHDVPALLAEVRRLRAVLGEVHEALTFRVSARDAVKLQRSIERAMEGE